MKKNNGNSNTNGAPHPPPNPAETTKPSSPVPDDSELAPANIQKALLDEDRAFTIRRWTPSTRQDLPEKTYLAPRRPGLPPLYGHHAYGNGTVSVAAPVVEVKKKTVKVKKTDPETGAPKIYDVMIIEGTEHTIDGEIIPSESSAPQPVANIPSDPSKPESDPSTPVPIKHEQITTESLAPGTVVEGVGVANEDGVVVAPAAAAALSTLSNNSVATLQQEVNRRRPPPPKRKKFGPGRGKKGPMKKVVFEGEGGQMEAVGVTPSSQATNGAAVEGAEGEAGERGTPNEGDMENDNDGDEEDDEGEGSEEGEIDAGLGEDQPITSEAAKAPEAEPSPPSQNPVATTVPTAEQEAASNPPPFNAEAPEEPPPASVPSNAPSISEQLTATTTQDTPSDTPPPAIPAESEPAAATTDTFMTRTPGESPGAAPVVPDLETFSTFDQGMAEDGVKGPQEEEAPGDADEMDLLGRLEVGIDEEGAGRA